MEIRELLKKRASLRDEAKKFLDDHTDKDGKLSASDAAIVERMIEDIDAASKNIDHHIIMESWDKELEKPFNTPILTPLNNNSAAGSYHKNFLNAIRTSFRDVRDELNEGTLPSGGYLLPTEMHDRIISTLTQENVLRTIGKTITTASEHKITFVASKPAAAWISEGEEISFSNETFGQISLNAYKLAVALKISNELILDSYYDIEQHIIEQFSQTFAQKEEWTFLNGDAPNCPKGLLPTLQTSATGTLQTTGSEITADDLLSLQYSVDRLYRKKGVWLMSDATLAQIRKLKDSTQNFIWQPGLVEGEPPRLFGQPVYTSSFMPAPVAGNVAVLYGNFADYFLIGERGHREFQPLRELYAMSGQTGFLMTERVDCLLIDHAAIRGLKIRS